MQSLAIKYRPQKFDDVVEQSSTIRILTHQLNTKSFKHAYLFVGSAGTGKTTCARIFAKEINDNKGNPIEMDAASQNGIEDVRNIIEQARTKSLDSEYKIFIIDECHAFSNNAWQAMLKLIEEPPAKSIFIFCTTNPEKIPKTIISRVQRYDFKRISQQGVVSRMMLILDYEGYNDIDKVVDQKSVEYIAKLADGGMRDALTLLDKCLSYSSELTIENIVSALGIVDYDIMIKLTKDLLTHGNQMFSIIEQLYAEGKDLKQFVKSYTHFILDVIKYQIGADWKYISIPPLDEYLDALDSFMSYDVNHLLDTLIKLGADIKYSSTPKYDIEAVLFLESNYGKN